MRNLVLFLFFIFSFTSIKSQFCSQTTLVNMGNITPTGVIQTVTGAASAKRYWTFNATAGCTYTLSTCGSPNSNDTYLRLYSGTNPLTAVLVTTNDDNGPICAGTKASIVWTCPTTGAYSILLTNYSCANLSASTTLQYRVVCAPPFNPCGGSYPTINCGINVNWSVISGNGAYNPPSITCGFSTPGQEKVYIFTAPSTGNYTLNQISSFNWIDYFFKPVSAGCSGTGWTCIDDLFGASSSFPFSLTSGVQYYIMLDPETTTGGNVSFNIECPPINLPIELVEFRGTNNDLYNDIFWVTVTETNNDYFTLERSVDGLVWEVITIVDGSGTSSTPKFYEHKDYNYTKEVINYYRLSQTDFNGQKEYFNIIAVNSQKNVKCDEYKYYSLLGVEINYETASTGVYLRKCGDKIEKVIKAQ